MARRDKPIEAKDPPAADAADALAQGVADAMDAAQDQAGGASVDHAAQIAASTVATQETASQPAAHDERAPDAKAGEDAARGDLDELEKKLRGDEAERPKLIVVAGEHEDFGDID